MLLCLNWQFCTQINRQLLINFILSLSHPYVISPSSIWLWISWLILCLGCSLIVSLTMLRILRNTCLLLYCSCRIDKNQACLFHSFPSRVVSLSERDNSRTLQMEQQIQKVLSKMLEWSTDPTIHFIKFNCQHFEG